MSQKRLFLLLLSHFDLRMGNYYIFETSKVEKETEIDEKEIKRIFDYFSYLPGDLENENKEFFFLENPVWRKPILAVGEQYYCFIPQLFFSFSLEILDEIIEKYDKVGLHDRRSTYLEYKIEEIVKRRFPSSQVVSGLQWESEGIRYETDLVAFIDSHAIIVEAKSQKISRPALRGAPDRIKKHLNEILIEPGIQSFRFENKLNTLINQIEKSDPLLQSLPVNIADIKKIIRVSVSLEDFATLQANLRLFTDTGWIPQDFEPCPSMNLADFETLFDFLEHPVQIIHYLIRRLELEGSIAFLGDELDFMGLYITTLLNKGNFSSDGQSEILISGMSEPLDKYYMSRDQGLSIEKPQPKVSPFFKKILSKLEDRATPRWTEIGCILNRFPPDDQIKISKNIKDLKRVVNRTWKQEGHKNISIYRPPETSEYAMAIVLFKDANRDKRDEFIQAASNFGLEPEHVRYCLVIAINIDRNDLPYHYIGLAEDRARPPA